MTSNSPSHYIFTPPPKKKNTASQHSPPPPEKIIKDISVVQLVTHNKFSTATSPSKKYIYITGLGSSTQVHQVPQIYNKYKYWSSTHFFRKYSSTSTSTHIKICSKVRMDIQSRVNFGWTK